VKQNQIATRNTNAGIVGTLLALSLALVGSASYAVTDYSTITAAAVWTDAIATFVVVGAALAAAFVAIKGVRFVLKLLK
jgi:hypothetical protein